MKKKYLLIAVYILTFAVTAINLFYSVSGSVFSDISNLPQGEFASAAVSPDGKSKINTYNIKNSVGKAVRCELELNGKVRNVFWQTGIDNASVNWINDRAVIINGVELDVIDGGFYDCRRGISLFQEGSIEGDEKNPYSNKSAEK